MGATIGPRSLLSGAHFVSKVIFEGLGHQFELRRSGEASLGLWRFKLKRKNTPAFLKRLVILPGFGDTPLSWFGVLLLLRKTLKKEFDEVLVVDFPGFRGYLSNKKCIASADFLQNLLKDVLDSLKPHTLLGHSLGGWLAASYTIKSIIKPEKLILVSPSGVCGSQQEWDSWNALFEQAMEGKINLRSFLFAKEPWWLKYFMSEIYNFMTREDIKLFLKSFREDHIIQSKLHEIQSPVALIWGEGDKLIPVGWAAHWEKGIQGGIQAFYLPEVGHTPQIEAPFKMAKVLRGVFT